MSGNFCPHYPAPAKKRPSAWRMFFSKRRSWLDALYERSYAMKMGEVHLPGMDPRLNSGSCTPLQRRTGW